MNFMTYNAFNEKTKDINPETKIILKYADPIGGKTELTMFECDDAVYCQRTMFIDARDESEAEIVYYRMGEIDIRKTINTTMSRKNDKSRFCEIPVDLMSKYLESETLKNNMCTYCSAYRIALSDI